MYCQSIGVIDHERV